MKATKIILGLAGLSVGIVTVVLPAGSKTNQTVGSQQVQSENEVQAKIFTGTIWANGARYVLRDAINKVWYQLDDQRAAARFEGDYVRVTGTLDVASNTIRVHRIEEDRGPV